MCSSSLARYAFNLASASAAFLDFFETRVAEGREVICAVLTVADFVTCWTTAFVQSSITPAGLSLESLEFAGESVVKQGYRVENQHADEGGSKSPDMPIVTGKGIC